VSDWYGRRLANRWTLVERLGAGGFGEVWRARDRRGGEVAIKRLLRPMSPTELAAFRRELHALEALDLPGVVGLLGSGTEPDGPWIAMDLVDATPFPGAPPPVAWDDLRPIVLRLLATLSGLHRRGFVHRDLSPTNLRVDATGAPVLLDFGLAIQADHDGGEAAGAPEWTAPEQIAGHPTDARTDLYTVGLLLVWSLTGRHAHPGETTAARQRARLRGAPPNLDGLPPAVAALVARLLQPAPQARPASAEAVLAAIEGDAGPAWTPPWLGDPGLPDRLAEAALGGPTELTLPRGTGATRLLAEVADRLVARAADVVLLDRDAPPPVAPWRGLAIRTGVDVDGALPRLTPADIEPLFDGPERILRLRSEPAALAVAATGGAAGLVVDLLRSWLREGTCRLTPEGRLRMETREVVRLRSRPATPPRRVVDDPDDAPLLALLAAYPAVPAVALHRAGVADADHRLARLAQRGVVEPASPGRWRALAAPATLGLDPRQRTALDEALVADPTLPDRWTAAWGLGGAALVEATAAWVAALRDACDPAAAHAALELTAARAATEALPDVGALAVLALEAALDQPSVDAFSRAREIALTLGDATVADRCEEGRLALLDGETALATLPRPADDRPDLALACARIRAIAAIRTPPEVLCAEVDALVMWARGRPDAAPHIHRWRGHAHHARRAWGDAARSYDEAAEIAGSPQLVIQLRCAAADDWLDASDPDAADRSLDAAEREVSASAWRFGKARIEVFRRQIVRARGVPAEPDLELVELLRTTHWTHLAGRAAMAEAIIAWRAGHPAAAALARTWRALLADSLPAAALLAGALLDDLGELVDRDALIAAALRPQVPPGIALQVLGLLRAPRSLAEGIAPRVIGEGHREVLSRSEALGRLID
jgi:hypothetical protein